MSLRRRLHTFSGQCVPLLTHCVAQKCFLMLRQNFSCCTLCPLPLVLALATIDKNWALSSLHPLFRYLLSTESSPEPLLQTEQSWLPQPFFAGEMLQSLTHLGLSLLSPAAPLFREIQSWTWYLPVMAYQCSIEGRITSFDLLAVLCQCIPGYILLNVLHYIADSCSPCCLLGCLGPFLQSCFPTGWFIACPNTWSWSSPSVGLQLLLAECPEVPINLSESLWMAAGP